MIFRHFLFSFIVFPSILEFYFLTFHSILHRSFSTWDRFRLFHFELSVASSSLPSILFFFSPSLSLQPIDLLLWSVDHCLLELLVHFYDFCVEEVFFFLRSFVDFFLCFNLFFWLLHNNSLFSFFQASGQSGLICGIFRSLGTFFIHRFSIEPNTSFPPNILIKIKDRQFVKCLVFHDSMPFKHKKKSSKELFSLLLDEWFSVISYFLFIVFPRYPSSFFDVSFDPA